LAVVTIQIKSGFSALSIDRFLLFRSGSCFVHAEGN
jgi:hypothetical protein